ncbi:hypothetical protein [Komagataeibacter sp. FNDCF1]|uniref:hypothetical protein n=1 Tax=Komagataeibacter sp. FNDCF1 TaxID=2878681 RepID=UPI001E31A7EB|nr:hypothetical protein [Komagataeibacter sp. FNDCF1]MCE2565207.1 hypothetical protein [Komagataeibacter sp. FNDCF1]
MPELKRLEERIVRHVVHFPWEVSADPAHLAILPIVLPGTVRPGCALVKPKQIHGGMN